MIALLLSLFAWSSSAFALFGDDEARAQIKQLTQQVDANEKSVEARLTKLEANSVSRSAILDLATQIQALQSSLADLRGQIEVINHRIDVDEKRQQELYLDIDTRLRKLEQPAEQAAAGQKPAAETAPTPAETQAYEAALNQFRVGKYSLAVAAFQKFLAANGSSSLAPSAQYWIGNGYFALGRYKDAIAAQQKLIASWPDSSKIPDAMLNIASSQDALGEHFAGRKTLEALIAKYPKSPAAVTAKQRLGAKH